MRKVLVAFVLMIGIMIGMIGFVLAMTPYLPVQGKLLDKDGKPVNENVNMDFKIYNAETGGTLLASQTGLTVQVSDGFFATKMDLSGLTSSEISNNDLWLEITVNGDTLSRIPVKASVLASYAPYAYEAHTAYSATHATNANYASSAAEADHATSADSATNAGKLGGYLPSHYLNTGSGAQTKSGSLTVQGTLTGSTVRATNQLCIGSSCKSSWPTGGDNDWEIGTSAISTTKRVGIGYTSPGAVPTDFKLSVIGKINADDFCLSGDCINDWSDVMLKVRGYTVQNCGWVVCTVNKGSTSSATSPDVPGTCSLDSTGYVFRISCDDGWEVISGGGYGWDSSYIPIVFDDMASHDTWELQFSDPAESASGHALCCHHAS